MSHQDELLAEAVAHLVGAYEAIDEISRRRALPSTSPAFMSASRMLCATLVAIDEFSQLIWVEDCPNSVPLGLQV